MTPLQSFIRNQKNQAAEHLNEIAAYLLKQAKERNT